MREVPLYSNNMGLPSILGDNDGNLSMSEFNKKHHTNCHSSCHFGWHSPQCKNKKGLNRTWLGMNSRDGRDYCGTALLPKDDANGIYDRSSNVIEYTCKNLKNTVCHKPRRIDSPNILETFDFSFPDNNGSQRRMLDFNAESVNTWYSAEGQLTNIVQPMRQPMKFPYNDNMMIRTKKK